MDAKPLHDRSRVLLDAPGDAASHTEGDGGQHVHYDLLAKQGRKAWSYLHSHRGCGIEAVKIFEAMIPNYGCDCQADYQRIKQDHPFDHSSPDAFFASTVRVHNAVNEKLCKPQVTIEKARVMWDR